MIVSELAPGDAGALEHPQLVERPIPTHELSWEYPKQIDSLLSQRPRSRSDRSWESWRWPMGRDSDSF